MLAALRDSASLSVIKSFARHEHLTVRAAAFLVWFKLVEQDKLKLDTALAQAFGHRQWYGISDQRQQLLL